MDGWQLLDYQDGDYTFTYEKAREGGLGWGH